MCSVCNQAAKKTHPDRHGQTEVVLPSVNKHNLDFVEIQEAYEVLSNKDRRSAYDAAHLKVDKKTLIRDRCVRLMLGLL